MENALSGQIPQILAGLESNRVAGRDGHLDARLGVPADAALPALDLEDAETAKLDPVAGSQSGPHRLDHRLDSGRRLRTRNVREVDHEIDDVRFDHRFL